MPKLLDLFCGAGGAAMGYHRAGFTEIVGVDNRPQKHYPFTFIQADALEFLASHGRDFDAIHASPPCQAYSVVGNHSRAKGMKYPDLVGPIRNLLFQQRVPFVIENVVGAPLVAPLLLCGSMFDPPMDIRRHRLFEVNFLCEAPTWGCRHSLYGPRFMVYEHYRKRATTTVRVNGGYTSKEAYLAMGIDWMTWRELTQAIPPVYTEFVGRQLLAAINWAA